MTSAFLRPALTALFGLALAALPAVAAGQANAGSSPDAGRALIAEIGCGSCHQIPGIAGADGMVGPPLDHIAQRQIIAGVLRNTPDNMVQWLRFPQKVVPGNAMPDMGLSEEQASAIAAYLYTLQ